MEIKKDKSLRFLTYNINQARRWFKYLTFNQFASIMYKTSVLSVCGMLLIAIVSTGFSASRANNNWDETIQVQLVHQEFVIQKQQKQINNLIAKVGKYGEIIRMLDDKMQGKWVILKQLDKGINDDMAKAIIYYAYKIAPLYDIDPDMVLAIAFVESRMGTHLFGPTGDFGPMQINYKTWAEELDITVADMLDVRQAIDIACDILSRSIKRHGDRYVGGYNGFGPGYEERVMKVYNKLTKES